MLQTNVSKAREIETSFLWPFVTISYPFQNDPGGIVYNRQCEPYDFVLDHWHPWEKVKYMDYFEQREKRKEEYDKYYEDVISKKGHRLIEPIEFPAPDK